MITLRGQKVIIQTIGILEPRKKFNLMHEGTDKIIKLKIRNLIFEANSEAFQKQSRVFQKCLGHMQCFSNLKKSMLI